jgi:hypothetical protein
MADKTLAVYGINEHNLFFIGLFMRFSRICATPRFCQDTYGSGLTLQANCQTITSMADWIKVLIGALTGMMVGLIAEPIKQWFAMVIDSRRIKKRLFDDLRLIYMTFCTRHGESNRWTAKDLVDNLKFCTAEKFTFYNEKKQEACYRLRGWSWIKGFFLGYLEIRSKALVNPSNPDQIINEIKVTFLEHAAFGNDTNSLLNSVERYYEKRGIRKMVPRDVGIVVKQ